MSRYLDNFSPRLSWRHVDIATRWIFPFALLIFGFFVIGMPFGLPGQAALGPIYAMACVYFWSLYRPSSLPAPLVAIAGLLLDLLNFSPFGTWAILLLLLHALILKLRTKLTQAAFPYVWISFVLVAIAGATLAWLITSACDGLWLPALPILTEAVWAIGLYPAVAAVLIRAHRGLAAIELV